MLKLSDILQEGTLQLTPDERQQVEDMLPNIIKAISGNYIGDNRMKIIGNINIISADKTPMTVQIQVGNDLSFPNANGYYETNDPNNPTDNIIFLQQFSLQAYFIKAGKIYSTLTGDASLGVEQVRRVLKHELIHAKDPNVNQHFSKEPYSSTDATVYYKSWAEFQTMTGQFFEAITTGVDRALNSGIPKEKILKSLDNILKVYSGASKEMLTQDTVDFIQGTGKRNIFQSLIKFAVAAVSNITGITIQTSLELYVLYISNIKKYNPEGYKEFLKDLYKTIDQAKDKLKNLKEMQYINEARRFQQLAGIISEAETQTDPVADKGAEQGLKLALNMIKAGKNSVKPSPKDGEIDEVAGLALGLVAGAPGLISVLGKAVNGVAGIFQKDNKKGTTVGNALKRWGHKLEDTYIGAIADILKVAFPKSFGNQSIEDKTSSLYEAAHNVYASILLAAAISSGFGAAEASNAILSGLEGGLSAFKTAEVISLAQKVAAV